MTYLGKDGLEKIWKTMVDLYKIANRSGFHLDLHPGNFMLGSDGHIVISDPFFAG
jgi:predicted unusual protein kinase regulating ubiquinone biosynthesis (AarF/ABC1/UbiB family)